MDETALVKIFRRLCQGSKESVQSGLELDKFDNYMHVERPIDKAVRDTMDEIRIEGGGILFLVGSAGDGKSHMISTLKNDYADFEFRNDASESPWPNVASIDALKIFLNNYKDATLHTTTTKMLVAINMGKLSAFIDDDEVQTEFSEIANCARTLFDEDDLRHKETNRVRIVSFANHQIFELFPEYKDSIYPIDSFFIKKVLSKITDNSCDNFFRTAFNNSKPVGTDFDPCYVNYQLLCIPALQDTIVKIIIEAIIRFKLMLTPRELFDFIYRIVIPDSYETFNSSKDFFKSLLPSLLFEGGENKIMKCLSMLDPLKHGSIEHNDYLAELFTSVAIPEAECFSILKSRLHPRFFEIIDEYYKNNRYNIGDISKLLFRMKHLMKYHSESVEYRSFLSILCGYYDNDEDRLFPLYETIQRSIPHLYGSYTDKQNLVPLDIQGKEYKLFVSCDNLKPNPQETVPFDVNNRNKFVVEIVSYWKINAPVPPLKVEYQLYEYLCKIQKGKLAQTDDRNHNLLFYGFISNLVQQTDFKEKVIILTSDNQQLTLSRTFGKKITLK
ncbi:MAG: DNA phosphorothioation-dependent restriction protein DptF [Bacteroides sp. 43_108]|nr:MAG: DNA phosphorothioation-dependent restriction protein DptF [Bacteroides sp. 43_108]